MPLPLIPTLIAAATLLIGFSLGWAMGVRRRDNEARSKDLEQRLEQALASRSDYEAEVKEHFQRTAGLLNQLSDDYREIYRHLAAGADQLCDGAVKLAGEGVAIDEGATLTKERLDIMQPLDYAPRANDNSQGQLSESFGLERTVRDDNVSGGN